MEKIYIRNTIGWHVTDSMFSAQFQEAIKKSDEVEIHINSPGGSVFMGWGIYNEIRTAVRDGILVKTFNNGLAASMASVIMLAAEKENRYPAENSLFMIHNPSGFAFGDEDKMKKERELLGKIGDLMSSLYAKTTETEADYMKALMKETTWYKPSEGVSEGFFNKSNIVDGGKPIEQVEVTGMDKSVFKGMPNSFENILCFHEKNATLDDSFYKGDLTKIPNSQIREKAWKNYLKH